MRYLLLAVLLSTSCIRHHIIAGPTATDMSGPPDHEQWNHHYIVGLHGDPKIRIEDYCKGSASLLLSTSFLNFLAQGVTFGLYNPTEVKIWCKSKRKS